MIRNRRLSYCRASDDFRPIGPNEPPDAGGIAAGAAIGAIFRFLGREEKYAQDILIGSLARREQTEKEKEKKKGPRFSSISYGATTPSTFIEALGSFVSGPIFRALFFFLSAPAHLSFLFYTLSVLSFRLSQSESVSATSAAFLRSSPSLLCPFFPRTWLANLTQLPPDSPMGPLRLPSFSPIRCHPRSYSSLPSYAVSASGLSLSAQTCMARPCCIRRRDRATKETRKVVAPLLLPPPPPSRLRFVLLFTSVHISFTTDTGQRLEARLRADFLPFPRRS